jgi:hypothetical protein
MKQKRPTISVNQVPPQVRHVASPAKLDLQEVGEIFWQVRVGHAALTVSKNRTIMQSVIRATYAKMGDDETFSKDEMQYFIGLSQGSGLVTKVTGGYFEVSTPELSQLEQGQ